MARLVTAEVKSPLASKTNITGALLVAFGLLSLFNMLPADFNGPLAADVLVTGGGLLVVLFRTIATTILREPTP